ncbi:hypothetical protein KAU34_06415 [candidate division WOR-3 bacterium]|nr:hypothetical protein [candidate division WOR-3 bacterium]
MNRIKCNLTSILCVIGLISIILSCSENIPPKQEKPVSKPPSKTETEIIEDIRKEFTLINNNTTNYRRVEKTLLAYEDGGEDLEAYFKGNKIRKIVYKGYGPVIKSVEEYYYWPTSALFFVFRKTTNYDKPPMHFDDAIETTKENRYYFHNNKLIRWLDENKRQVAKTDPQFIQEQKTILDDSNKYLLEAKSH